jgi:protocatechuate 3,4-dioxygenase alpha subunit
MERLCGRDFGVADSKGARVTIRGRVIDGDGKGVPDAVLEIWQSENVGPPTFSNTAGFGRVATDEHGAFEFTTSTPRESTERDGSHQAPHLAVSIFMRGLLKRLVTRIYFEDQAANRDDLILNLVEPGRRETLLARRAPDSQDTFEWNVILQGPEETVFFDF